MAIPIQRLRRLRQHEAVRRMVQETSLTPSDVINPLFVAEGRDRREVIAKVMALPEADLKEPLPSRIQMRFENRVAWAKS
jgi:delta-aminolevulinic acid dehydratase/porphobilinogen synthase